MIVILWFCLLAILLTVYVILDGFDLGAGIVQLFVAKADREKGHVLQSIAPVWDGNEVWLIAAGGMLFCIFPVLYASAFSGFYLALMIVLWLLILRGISIELRNHIDNPLWKPLWDSVFGAASAVLALVLGVALGNVVRGVPIDSSGYFFLPLWTNFTPGDEAGILDWYTLLVGAASLIALTVHGSLWLVLKTSGDFEERSRAFGRKCWWGLAGITLLISLSSFAIQPNLSRQFQRHPWGAVFPLLAVVGLAGARVLSGFRKDLGAFASSSLYLAGMLASAAFGIFPNVLPSNATPDFSLTIYNASTNAYGLVGGLWWFLPGLALATAYSVFTYRHFAGKVE